MKPAHKRILMSANYRLMKYVHIGVDNKKPWEIDMGSVEDRDKALVEEYLTEHAFGSKLFTQGTSSSNKEQWLSCYQWHLMCRRHNKNGRGGRDSMETIESILRSQTELDGIFRFLPPFEVSMFKEVKRLILAHNDTIKVLNKVTKESYTGEFLYDDNQALNLLDVNRVLDTLIPKLTRDNHQNTYFKNGDFLNEYLSFDYGKPRKHNITFGGDIDISRMMETIKELDDLESIKHAINGISKGVHKDVTSRLGGCLTRNDKLSSKAKHLSSNVVYPTNDSIEELVDFIVHYTTLKTIKNILLLNLDKRSFAYGKLNLYANYNSVYDWRDYSYEKEYYGDEILDKIKDAEVKFFNDIDVGYNDSIILFMNLLEIYGLNKNILDKPTTVHKENEYVRGVNEQSEPTYMDDVMSNLFETIKDKFNGFTLDDFINMVQGEAR